MARVSIFLIIVALISVTIGCASPPLAQYNLTISSTEGGSVTGPGEGIFTYGEGEAVNLIAKTDEGYQFVSWTGDVGTIASVNTASTTITMNDDYSITATFAVKQYNLVIHSTERGSVTTPGENAYTYDKGEVVNLVAVADEGYVFINWTGDVSTIADVNAASTTITMSADYVITANFGPPIYGSLDYFPIAEGYGIKYHVTDSFDYAPLNVNVWVVSQYYETAKPNDLDFLFTLVKEGTGGEFNPNSLGGQISLPWDGEDLTAFYAGYPSANQGNHYGDFCILRTFSFEDEWTWAGRQYAVEQVGQQTVNGVDFDDCVKVSIDSSSRDEVYMRGSGYFILARDVGIIELVFNRTSGTRVSYEYIEHRQLARHTISGSIRTGGMPVEGLIVQISNGNWGTRSVTDSNGAFSIQAYGPDVVLRLGYDEDNDDVFDLDDYPEYPKEYSVNNIVSDIVGLSIDTSML